MAYKIINQCPVCSNNLTITKLKCSQCNTVIENDFELSPFEYLNPEQLKFAEIFVRCRGNIKDVEKELGISYPTVRAKLDEVISVLDHNHSNEKETIEHNKKKDIIEMLEKGEITAEEALTLLKQK